MAAKLIFPFLVFLLFPYQVKPDLDNVVPLLTQLTDGFNAERKNMSLEALFSESGRTGRSDREN